MATITNPVHIRILGLKTALRALRLEARGMTRRGRSVTAVYRDYFDLPARCSRATVIKRVEQEIDKLEAESNG